MHLPSSLSEVVVESLSYSNCKFCLLNLASHSKNLGEYGSLKAVITEITQERILCSRNSLTWDPKRRPQPSTIHLNCLEPPCDKTCRSSQRREQDSLLYTLQPTQRHENGPV
ncbi:hypothetical protein GQX74_001296 [Glossina fuscipes]|nr:hypothetical protein GQX74_001296 [Glossina fuscipes]